MTATTKTIAEELFEAAASVAVIPQTGRTRDAVLRDLCKAIEVVPDGAWEQLSQPARDWYNASVAAINALKDPPALQGYDSADFTPPVSTEKEPEPQPEITPVLSPVPDTPPPAAPVVAPTPITVTSASEILREVVIQHDDWSEAQIKEAAIAKGAEVGLAEVKFTDNLVWTIRNYTKAAMKTARKLGWKLVEESH